jgi:hypothetical protein
LVPLSEWILGRPRRAMKRRRAARNASVVRLLGAEVSMMWLTYSADNQDWMLIWMQIIEYIVM